MVVDGDAAIIGVGLMLESGDHYRGGFGMSWPSWGKELMADERGGENSFIVWGCYGYSDEDKEMWSPSIIGIVCGGFKRGCHD